MYAADDSDTSSAFKAAEKRYQRHIQQLTGRGGNGRSRGSKTAPSPIDLSEVIDFASPDSWTPAIQKAPCGLGDGAYLLCNRPGFCYIPSALTLQEQQQLAQDCLINFTQRPAHTNHSRAHGDLANLWAAAQEGLHLSPLEDKCKLDAGDRSHSCSSGPAEVSLVNEDLPKGLKTHQQSSPTYVRSGGGRDQQSRSPTAGPEGNSNCWSDCGDGVPAVKLLEKLRWACLGPNFDWTGRRYLYEQPHRPVPPYLASLAKKCTRLAASAGCRGDRSFNPDVALINFYKGGDTLGGHLDDVEKDLHKPIVSLSLGCNAIFLLGGDSKAVPPVALLVRSGDAMVLAGASRRYFHGVPRILVEHGPAKAFDQSVVQGADEQQVQIARYMSARRINISLRESV